MTVVDNSANCDQCRLGVCFEPKMLRIFVMRDLRTGIVFQKMMPPGTTSLISVPELEELQRELASDAVGTLSHSLQIGVNLRAKGE
jgi:hypothetical protein